MAFYQGHRHLLTRPPEQSHPPPPASAAHGQPHQIQKPLSMAFGSVLCVTFAYLIVVAITNYLRNRRDSNNDDSKHQPLVMMQLEAMPVVAYGSCSSRLGEDACSICLGEYDEGAEVRELPECRHLFHKGCVDRWLLTRSSFCPICRARAVDRAVEPKIRNFSNDSGRGEAESRVDESV